MPFQSPVITALQQGGSLVNQTYKNASNTLDSVSNILNIAGSLAMKLNLLLEQEEASKMQQAMNYANFMRETLKDKFNMNMKVAEYNLEKAKLLHNIEKDTKKLQLDEQKMYLDSLEKSNTNIIKTLDAIRNNLKAQYDVLDEKEKQYTTILNDPNSTLDQINTARKALENIMKQKVEIKKRISDIYSKLESIYSNNNNTIQQLEPPMQYNEQQHVVRQLDTNLIQTQQKNNLQNNNLNKNITTLGGSNLQTHNNAIIEDNNNVYFNNIPIFFKKGENVVLHKKFKNFIKNIDIDDNTAINLGSIIAGSIIKARDSIEKISNSSISGIKTSLFTGNKKVDTAIAANVLGYIEDNFPIIDITNESINEENVKKIVNVANKLRQIVSVNDNSKTSNVFNNLYELARLADNILKTDPNKLYSSIENHLGKSKISLLFEKIIPLNSKDIESIDYDPNRFKKTLLEVAASFIENGFNGKNVRMALSFNKDLSNFLNKDKTGEWISNFAPEIFSSANFSDVVDIKYDPFLKVDNEKIKFNIEQIKSVLKDKNIDINKKYKLTFYKLNSISPYSQEPKKVTKELTGRELLNYLRHLIIVDSVRKYIQNNS